MSKPFKGFGILLEALVELNGRGLDFHCVVVGGDAPNDDSLERAGVANRLTFFGFVPRADLAPYYRAGDVFVNPSLMETDANTVLEALACGTPAITADIKAFSRKATLNFKSGDSADLADKLVEFHAKMDNFKSQVRANASTWDIRYTIDKLVEIYSSALKPPVT